MRHSSHSGKQATGWGGALALFPLGFVFAGILFLAVGAGRTPNAPAPAGTQVTASQAPDESAADEAAAAAVIAISLARVAPALPESALEPPPEPKTKPVQAEAPRKAAPQREASAKPAAQQAPRQAPAQQTAKPQDITPQPAIEPKPAEEGILARIGSYAPSPKKIAGAVSDGVSKIASYIPGL